jgi:L-ascorbate metabolism protein UlaG (beta-lactamase superfamily)
MAKLARGLKWFLFATLALAAIFVSGALIGAWPAFGARAQGVRRARMERSPQWHDGAFANPEPIVNHAGAMLDGMLHISEHASPMPPLQVAPLDPALLRTAPASGLRITWFGHSSSLIELDGQRVLTDPSWSERSSPLPWLGPKHWFAPPIALADLPPIDAVVISHDHYDHLDYPTMVALADVAAKFVVPLGIGAYLEGWGIAPEKIVELDWWERTQVRELTIVCTPARHASGRTPFDRDQTLWASWALLGREHRVYFSGDTGLFNALREIGRELGPFDVTLIEVGQYHAGWPDWHIGPEQALKAHAWLRGKVMVPVHWGGLQLAYHGWTEPVERVLAAAQGTQLVIPQPGRPTEPTSAPAPTPWWPKLPFQSASDAPIVSSGVTP